MFKIKLPSGSLFLFMPRNSLSQKGFLCYNHQAVIRITRSSSRKGCNMKVFLFMYPLGQFFEEVPDLLSFSFEPERGPLSRDDLYGIDKIIDARYRGQGYEIAWVFYGQRGKKHLPDATNLTRYVTIQPDDLLISSGSYTGEPNFDFIFGQLPEGIDELVVGGFHWTSCVAFTADYAIEALGLNTYVDEDTTQTYFVKTSLMRKKLGRDVALMGEVCQPWQIAGTHWDQEYYCQGMILKPWIVRQPPTDEFTFFFNDKLESFPRQELEMYFAPKGHQ